MGCFRMQGCGFQLGLGRRLDMCRGVETLLRPYVESSTPVGLPVAFVGKSYEKSPIADVGKKNHYGV
jgi:hypothetical protein